MAIGDPGMPNGTTGSRVPRSVTHSTAQKQPVPRTSPMIGRRSAIARSSGPMTSSPSRRAFAIRPSSSRAPIVATAAAVASG